MGLRSESIQKFWPTTQSLDLVEAPIEVAAKAVLAEMTRCCSGEPVASDWLPFNGVDGALSLVGMYTNVPTFFLVLPTRSKWTVLWNNSFLCDGYDSLCWCLTRNLGLTTLHWCAHDEWTTSQAGAQFTYRQRVGGGLIERFVYCGQEDRRWIFNQGGDPLPAEAAENYSARRKRDRLNETVLYEFLGRLGARPWSEEFYAVGEKSCFTIRRMTPPPAIVSRTVQEVLDRAKRRIT